MIWFWIADYVPTGNNICIIKNMSVALKCQVEKINRDVRPIIIAKEIFSKFPSARIIKIIVMVQFSVSL